MRASDRVRLSRRAVEVSRLGFGGGPLGGFYEPLSEADARATVTQALSHGIRLFDTAPLYGLGVSERRLGPALSTVSRSTFVLTTKVGRLLRPRGDAAPGMGADQPPDVDEASLQAQMSLSRRENGFVPVWDFSRDGVRRSLEESLLRLQLDRADIVYVHDPEEHMEQALSEAIPALLDLRAQGMVSAIGVGVDHVWSGLRFVRETDIDMVLIAGRCTLLDRTAAAELLPLCEERGVGVVAASVFHGGILAEPVTSPVYWYKPAPKEIVARALAMRDVCDGYAVPLRAAALQFPLRYPAVVTVLAGVRTPTEVDEDVAAFNVEIPGGLWKELDALAGNTSASGAA